MAWRKVHFRGRGLGVADQQVVRRQWHPTGCNPRPVQGRHDDHLEPMGNGERWSWRHLQTIHGDHPWHGQGAHQVQQSHPHGEAGEAAETGERALTCDCSS